MIAPDKTGTQKKLQAAFVIITTRGVAPAGGCSVEVNCITPIEVETAKAMTHQSVPKRWSNVRLISVAKQ